MSGGDGKDSRGPTGGVKGGASDQGPNVGHGGSMDINIPGMGDVHIDGVHGLNPGQDNSTNWDGGNGNGNGGRDSSSSGDSQGAAIRRQVNAIKNDPKVSNILKELQKKVRAVTPYAKVVTRPE